MSRITYECDNITKNVNSDDPTKPFACAPDKYCFYCCCNPQCCLVIHRKPPKHFWEAWYFWLGVALLVIIIVSTVGTYIATNWKENLHAITYGARVSQHHQSPDGSGVSDLAGRNEVSINIIPTSAMVPTHKKILLVAPPPSCTYLTPIVA